MQLLAPVVLFVYNRVEHTRQVIDALKCNSEAKNTPLIVFSDGPKSPADLDSVSAVRNLIRMIDGFDRVDIILRDQNLGLANSIISGVTYVIERFGRVIVLEDDLIVSPYFLRYMNDALDRYENQLEVVSVHGYSYPVSEKLPETFFIRGADCWGWGTWKRGWEIFEPDGKKLLAELERTGLAHKFNYDGVYSFTGMLKDQIAGRNNSWAIRWHASAFLSNRLTLYPGRSLVKNIGFDSSGTHCGSSEGYDVSLDMAAIPLMQIPIEESIYARGLIKNYFRETHGGCGKRVARYMKSFVKCVLKR
ncbi:MAG: glycosyltransferase [Gammaproteobacteria bacterium]|nr:glycosyltransferase [Gammaproteobacteria bacterium]